MTTINTIEDLMRILDNNPEWLEALRTRLLTRELLDMPNTLARFMESTNQKFEGIDQKFEQIDQRFEQIDRRFEQIDQRFEQIDQKFEQVDQRFDRIDSEIQSIRDDLGVLKGAHARSAAVRRFRLIADDMGLHQARLLSPEEIWDIAQQLRRVGTLSRNEYESFHDADMIVEALDTQDERCYIAVEVSFTANGRDSSRAIRNAGFLARHTGQPAHPVVASVETDREIHTLFESGDLHWHRMPRQVLEAD